MELLDNLVPAAEFVIEEKLISSSSTGRKLKTHKREKEIINKKECQKGVDLLTPKHKKYGKNY